MQSLSETVASLVKGAEILDSIKTRRQGEMARLDGEAKQAETEKNYELAYTLMKKSKEVPLQATHEELEVFFKIADGVMQAGPALMMEIVKASVSNTATTAPTTSEPTSGAKTTTTTPTSEAKSPVSGSGGGKMFMQLLRSMGGPEAASVGMEPKGMQFIFATGGGSNPGASMDLDMLKQLSGSGSLDPKQIKLMMAEVVGHAAGGGGGGGEGKVGEMADQ
jgi:hypothetical protein